MVIEGSASDTNRGRPRILLAEDSPTQAEKLKLLLEEQMYEVLIASNGRQALAAARRNAPALIISDVIMPEMNGFSLCGEIKRDEGLKDIPVILLTSLFDMRDVLKGLECGADNFIRKPYQDQYLLGRIDTLLKNREARRTKPLKNVTEVYLDGQKHFITAERQQIVELLISIYDQAVQINKALYAQQSELARSNRLLKGLYQIAEGLNQAVSKREVCEKVIEYATELPGVQAGWLYLRDKDDFRLAAECNLPALFNSEKPDICKCQRLFLTGELGHDVRIIKCDRLAGAGNDFFHSASHISVPLWSGHQSQGIMNLMAIGQDTFQKEELEAFNGVGHQISVALERGRLHEQMERLVEERTRALTAEIEQRKEYEIRIVRLNRIHSVLSGINTTIVRVRGIQELFDEACRIAVEHGRFELAWIGRLDEQTRKIIPMASATLKQDDLSPHDLHDMAHHPAGSWLISRVLAHHEPAICNVLSSEEYAGNSSPVEPGRDYRSAVVFPLTLDGQLAGVMVLYAAEAGFFDEEEMALLVEMAGDVSFAMDHLKKEERINYLAFFNAVTDLPNRALFLDRVDQKITMAHQNRQMLSVIVLDLERFSSINESLGHSAGNGLLQAVARRLKEKLSPTDVLAHLSADYFAIARIHDEDSTDISHILDKALSGIQDQPFLVGGQELRISARAGTSSYPVDGTDTDTLVRKAETALKRAKLSADKHQFYAPEFHARVREKLKLETKLRQALEQEQLVLHYQPKIDLESGHISGLEALLRWQDPEEGLVPPLSFIPVLEETRMILEAGRWALGKAIEDGKKWRNAGFHPPKIAVNVSPIQLRQKDFVDMVARVLDNAGDVKVGLELEITESVIMQDIEANIQKLRIIRDMGLEVAIDDFGTGYSSLGYIAKLPVNVLKIDRGFITNMTSNPDDRSIVSAIISLAHSLHLRVTAEGVETREQADLLRQLKCEEMQGYLFSPAVTADRIETFLRERKSLAD